jgi:SOS-response transcriptional repressor LexA
VIGRIAAGKPLPTEEDITGDGDVESISIDGTQYHIHRLGQGKRQDLLVDTWNYRWFLTRVVGDSMDNAQPPIYEGDYVLLRGQARDLPIVPQIGDIVAAVIPDVDRLATLKRLIQEDGKKFLQPESSNPEHQPFELTKEVQIAGVALAILKKTEA